MQCPNSISARRGNSAKKLLKQECNFDLQTGQQTIRVSLQLAIELPSNLQKMAVLGEQRLASGEPDVSQLPKPVSPWPKRMRGCTEPWF